MAYDLGDYNEVAHRIVEFREKHPEGSLQPVNPDKPYEIVTIRDPGDKEHVFVVFTAAAYRTPDDSRPGIGTAWEPFPGPTQFTRDSEMQNAETSAWGRALVAVLAADTKTGVASANEVRNRQEPEPWEKLGWETEEQRDNVYSQLTDATTEAGDDAKAAVKAAVKGKLLKSKFTPAAAVDWVKALWPHLDDEAQKAWPDGWMTDVAMAAGHDVKDMPYSKREEPF